MDNFFKLNENGHLERIPKLPPDAKQIHFGKYNDVLQYRGVMEKNSIGLYIFEKLKSEFEYWTNPKFSDNLDPIDLVTQMRYNLTKMSLKLLKLL